jgi:NhaP-type Na+/H+ or K+/H+ antiporter
MKEKLFIGWFGPRGLVSIVFAVMLPDIQLPHEKTIITTTVLNGFPQRISPWNYNKPIDFFI